MFLWCNTSCWPLSTLYKALTHIPGVQHGWFEGHLRLLFQTCSVQCGVKCSHVQRHQRLQRWMRMSELHKLHCCRNLHTFTPPEQYLKFSVNTCSSLWYCGRYGQKLFYFFYVLYYILFGKWFNLTFCILGDIKVLIYIYAKSQSIYYLLTTFWTEEDTCWLLLKWKNK